MPDRDAAAHDLMTVWLLKIGEPVAVLNRTLRPMRMSLLADALRRRGHKVVWWTSAFMHGGPKPEPRWVGRLTAADGIDVQILPSKGYRRHISIARLREHRDTAAQFLGLAALDTVPDLILSALPTLELCDAATRYGRRSGVPVVIDVRDWWPDILSLASPGPIRPFVSAAIWPLTRIAKRALSSATAITGMTDEFVEWGLRKAKRRRTEWDVAFPFGYPEEHLNASEREGARTFWANHGVHLDPESPPIVVFAGTLGHAHDLRPILRAAERLDGASRIRFILCGDGERLETYRAEARRLTNVVLPGRVGRCELQLLLENAAGAVNNVPNRADYLASINNKPVEYLRFGLPIVASPNGSALAYLVAREKCGIVVDSDDPAALAGAFVSLLDLNQAK